jgi:hypothetical protein
MRSIICIRPIKTGSSSTKFYPFISPYKSCWIVGATVETPKNGTTKIDISNEVLKKLGYSN